ncbi:BUL1 [Candida pseudojiufengensis]|uniref:BUL1 n=1 Tax=Candida pseudojiufengensis TaxID=497109 RepID=UPI0022259271|nr:BUL1 [Candida pseudojiufengensis]KAI5961629.1 BUL1 [Candida pseudojiufengensis]
MSEKPIPTKSKSFDETIGTILPSYLMYTQTIGKNVKVPEENDDVYNQPPPPIYSNDEIESSNSTNSAHFSILQSSTSSITNVSNENNGTAIDIQNLNSDDDSLIVADENTNWRETVLDNVHKLPNMTFENNDLSNSVKMEIFFTKEIGEINRKPEFINPSLYEYTQGDLLNGYLTIRNTSNKPISFEMFYLLFEGSFMVANNKDLKDLTPVKIRRFLEMFDFSGSWNDAHINRLVSESEDIYFCTAGDFQDPIDGTNLYFKDKILRPNRTYKRFFSFKIPENLLDSECNEHSLSKHTEIPPTLGLSRWEIKHYPEREDQKIRDLSIINTSIGYGVMGRFIGKKSTWESEFGKFETPKHKDFTKLVNSKGDEYIILKEITNFVRVIPRTKILTDNEKLMKQVENKLLYENFIKRIKDKIDVGEQLLKSIENQKFDDTIEINESISQQEIEAAKLQQSYKQVDSIRDLKSNIKKLEYYESMIPLIKKSITGDKNLGILSVKTPKTDYTIKYIPPLRFRDQSIDELANTWNLNIPIDLSVQYPNNKIEPPIIKNITSELVVHTLKSMSKPIALEFNHELIYNKVQGNSKSFQDLDTFQHNIIKPLQDYSNKLYNLLKTLGTENFKIEKSLIDDIKSICQLDEKIMNLVCNDIKVDEQKYTPKTKLNWQRTQSQTLSTSFNLNINLHNLSLKGISTSKDLKLKSFNKFNLVPNFQNCFLIRFYHLKLSFELSNGDCIRIKIPITIEK